MKKNDFNLPDIDEQELISSMADNPYGMRDSPVKQTESNPVIETAQISPPIEFLSSYLEIPSRVNRHTVYIDKANYQRLSKLVKTVDQGTIGAFIDTLINEFWKENKNAIQKVYEYYGEIMKRTT